jgi:hypothetical protein
MMEGRMHLFVSTASVFSLLLPFIHNQLSGRNQMHMFLVSFQRNLNPTKLNPWFELKMLILEVCP